MERDRDRLGDRGPGNGWIMFIIGLCDIEPYHDGGLDGEYRALSEGKGAGGGIIVT